MAFFKNLFRQADPKEEALAQPEQEAKKEIVPEHSPETLRMVEQLDGKINESQALLGGLGRMAREKILTDPEALNEIYAPKKIGVGELRESDAWAFEPADDGLLVRNAVKRVVTLGLAGSKYAMEGEEEMVDKRKLKKDVRGELYGITQLELMEVAKKLDFKPTEKSYGDFSTKYVAGETGAEKVILRKKTEQEMDQTAGEILARRLNDLETKTGPDLVRQKQGLEEFIKLKEQNKDILGEDDVRAKLSEEESARQGLIEEKQAALNSDLEIFRAPLLEQRNGLAEAIEGFSPILAEATGQEKAYEQEIKGLQDKIRRIKGAKPLAEVLGDKIQAWEEEKAQAEANQKDFKEKKQTLNTRLAELKRSQAEVDKMLERIDKIGKTPAELKREREEKQQAEKQQREAKEAQGKEKKAEVEVPLMMIRDMRQQLADRGLSRKEIDKLKPEDAWEIINSGESAPEPEGEKVEIKFSDAKTGQEAAEPEEADDYSSDDDLADAAERARAEANDRDALDKAEPPKTEKVIKSVGKEVVPEAPAAAPEPGAGQAEGGEGGQAEKEMIVRPVRFWLNAIFGGKLNVHDDKIMRRHFRLAGKFDKFQNMTSRQAERALAGYQREAEGFISFHAREEAQKKIGEIVKNIDAYDREDGEAASRRPTRAAGGPAGAPEAQGGQAETEANAPGQAGTEPTEELLRNSYDTEMAGGKPAEPAAAAPEQTKAGKGKKPKEKGKENPAGRGGAKRRQALNKLRSQDVSGAGEDEANKDQPAQTSGNAGEAPASPNEKKLEPAGDLNNALDEALKKIEPETTGAAPNPEQAEAVEGIKPLVEAVKAHLQEIGANGNRKRLIRRAIERNFGSDKKPKIITTEAEIIRAVADYSKEMGGQSGEVALKAAEQTVSEIKAKLKK